MTLLYTSTIFLSALLLFLVQPMVGKMLLPLLGGSPAVWNTAMVFFQAVLLGGYLYAHLSQRWLKPAGQAALHLLLLVAAAVTLPVMVPAEVPPSVVYQPVSWLLLTLVTVVGLPLFALSANAPLLQSWLASTGHKDADNPYFLYAASNVGSMIALLGYPLLVEPYLRVGQQTSLWAYGFYALILCIASCAVVMKKQGIRNTLKTETSDDVITWKRRCWWLLLAFVPSSMLMGTTTIITTDIASAPLLWIIPLALYLLSFVFVFARKPIFYERSRNALFPLAMFIAVVRLVESTVSETGLVFIYILLMFCCCMVCHHRLAENKPSASRLTEFYLMMSLGGVLGGIFNALLAPVIFSQVWEYPVALALACTLCPPEKLAAGRKLGDILAPLMVLAAIALLIVTLKFVTHHFEQEVVVIDRWIETHNPMETPVNVFSLFSAMAVLVPLVACFLFRERPLRFGIMIFILSVISVVQPMHRGFAALLTERNFFGVVKVREYAQDHMRMLLHGTTMHGSQSTLPEMKNIPGGYYHPQGPFGQVFDFMALEVAERNIGVLGLGTGALSCLARPEDKVTFYEIDPLVEKIASDPNYFTFLQDCPPHTNVVLGDGRLELAHVANHSYDILVLDAFSSDAIPTHLLTRESFDLYKRKLKEHGVLLVHVSNRHLDLERAVSTLGQAVGMRGFRVTDMAQEKEGLVMRFPTNLIMLTSDEALLQRFHQQNPDWNSLPPPRPDLLWTDDFSNILKVIRH